MESPGAAEESKPKKHKKKSLGTEEPVLEEPPAPAEEEDSGETKKKKKKKKKSKDEDEDE